MRFVQVCAAVLLATGVLAVPVLAHTLESQGNIGAVLHIDPNDEPLANTASTGFLEIKDTSHKFLAADCLCRLVIKKGDTELATIPLVPQSPTSFSFTYTFPEQAAYTLLFLGNSEKDTSFQAFELGYSLRVAQAASVSPSTTSWPWVLVGGGILSIAIFYFVRARHHEN